MKAREVFGRNQKERERIGAEEKSLSGLENSYRAIIRGAEEDRAGKPKGQDAGTEEDRAREPEGARAEEAENGGAWVEEAGNEGARVEEAENEGA